MDILSAWYDNFVMKTPMSVGVYVSESIYGVPDGLVFSMPALIRNDERRGWYPFKWCEECRETFNMDHRPRWTYEPDPMNDPSPECRTWEASVCKRHLCAERKVSKRCCRHHRNPDVFLPDDPLLSLTGVVITVFKIFSEVKFLIGRYAPKEQDDAKDAPRKIRVSFFGEQLDTNESDKPGIGRRHVSMAGRESPKTRKQSPSYVVRRKLPTRGFHDDRAEKIRKELHEEEKKWDKFLDESIEPKEMMKYMARPVPTELTGIITGAVKMSDLDKQVEKIIKERHKLMAEAAEQEIVPEEEGEGGWEQSLGLEHEEVGQKENNLLHPPSISDTSVNTHAPTRTSNETEYSYQVQEREDAIPPEGGEEDLKIPSSRERKEDGTVTREDEEKLEEENRLRKLLDAISTDDIPIYKMMRFVFPASPNIPEDPNDPYWYLKNKDYVRHVTNSLAKSGFEDSMGVMYRKEFDANRLAAVEHFWNDVVPRQYGHVYYTPKELSSAEKIQNLKIDINSKLLPERFADFKDLQIKSFVPPTREMGENDILYDLRVAMHLRKFKDDALRDFMNRPPGSVRMDSGVWATVENHDQVDQGDQPDPGGDHQGFQPDGADVDYE